MSLLEAGCTETAGEHQGEWSGFLKLKFLSRFVDFAADLQVIHSDRMCLQVSCGKIRSINAVALRIRNTTIFTWKFLAACGNVYMYCAVKRF